MSPLSPTEFRLFYEEHVALVWRVLFRLGVVRADLADAVQEVFLVAYRKFPEFEAKSKPSTWLVGICYRVASDRRRRAHLRREVIDTGAMLARSDERPRPDELVEHNQRVQVLDQILTQLRPQQREVFVMFELEALSGREIASMTGVPIKTVFSRLRLAREAFADALAKRTAEIGRATVPPLSVASLAAKGQTP